MPPAGPPSPILPLPLALPPHKLECPELSTCGPFVSVVGSNPGGNMSTLHHPHPCRELIHAFVRARSYRTQWKWPLRNNTEKYTCCTHNKLKHKGNRKSLPRADAGLPSPDNPIPPELDEYANHAIWDDHRQDLSTSA